MITVDPAQLESARRELRAMVRDYLFNREYSVNLIDFGFPQHTTEIDGRTVQYWDDTSVALRFHVTKKISEQELRANGLKLLPRRIGQFETDVIEAEYGASLPRGLPSGQGAARREKLCGGLGISAFRNMYGTLGGIVQDRVSREPMILSNWHVLYGNRNTRPGHPIYQPIMLFNSGEPSLVARVDRERLSAPGADQLPLDGALAKLLEPARWENFQLGIGRVNGAARATLGMRVVKSGLTTGVTRGVVSGIEGFSKQVYDGDWVRLIEHGVTISRAPLGTLDVMTAMFKQRRYDNRGIVSMAGDSGSWWLDEPTRKAVALHFAGNGNATRAQGIDMQFVLDELKVEIADQAA